MKTKNLSEEYLLYIIKFLTGKIIDCKHTIRRCEILIKKEKLVLNNSDLNHDALWMYRFDLKRAIASKQIYQNELKQYQKALSSKY